MKPPHGLVYAVLIIVAILVVTLYAKYQSSSIVTNTALKAQPHEPVGDDAPTNVKNDPGSSAESAKSTEDAPK